MNLEKAREVALQIRKEDGAHWDQVHWWYRPGMVFPDDEDYDELLASTQMAAADLLERKCGTTGCVAGWTIALEYPDAVFLQGSAFRVGDRVEAVSYGARMALELTPWQATWVFDSRRTMRQVLWALENDNGDWDPAEYYDYAAGRK